MLSENKIKNFIQTSGPKNNLQFQLKNAGSY